LVNGGYSKNPGLAAIGSFFIPGLGQVYNGEGYIKGLMFLIGTLIGYLLLIVPGVIIWFYGIYNAYSKAKKINAGVLPYKSVSMGSLAVYVVLGFVIIFIWIAVFTIVLAAIIAMFTIAVNG
jgi:hypothetical protein